MSKVITEEEYAKNEVPENKYVLRAKIAENIEANPEEEATDTLETLKVNGKNYNVGGSGGSSLYQHTISLFSSENLFRICLTLITKDSQSYTRDEFVAKINNYGYKEVNGTIKISSGEYLGIIQAYFGSSNITFTVYNSNGFSATTRNYGDFSIVNDNVKPLAY